jgi:hypothetical protein
LSATFRTLWRIHRDDRLAIGTNTDSLPKSQGVEIAVDKTGGVLKVLEHEKHISIRYVFPMQGQQ